MVRDGYFYGLGFGLVAVVLWILTHSVILLAVPILLVCFFLWFFRDPNRTIPADTRLIVSPADGVVTEADWISTPDGTRLRLSIFLNVFNVHVNRSPVGGTVVACDYRKGSFRNAMSADSSTENEHTRITIDGGGYQVSFRQIAGLLARRIVTTVKPGDVVQRGVRVGLIKFGSRVDVYLPPSTELLVQKGTKVAGGSSVLGRLAEPFSGGPGASA
jgi:phosphatidylserine decarboxylase